MDFINAIASRLALDNRQVKNTIELLDNDCTIPFISRYRKEMTGSLDEMEVIKIRDEYNKLKELAKRKETVLKTIDEQGLLTNELRQKIEACEQLNVLEDIYLPYKPKKQTRGTKAKAKGLLPLAKILMAQKEVQIFKRAEEFINDMVPDIDEALAGARDIVAEWINENARTRSLIRKLFSKEAVIYSKSVKKKEQEGHKYQDYFNWHESLRRCPSHRILAMLRGEKERFLKLTIEPEEEKAQELLKDLYVKSYYDVSEQVKMAAYDAYKRLIQPSLETEFKNDAKETADDEAIKVFSNNLRQLLLAPPLGEKNVMAIDPGYRTGCKLVCLNKQGTLKHHDTIFPHPPQNKKDETIKKIQSLVKQYEIDAIAVGNGTAGRETEALAREIKFDREVSVFMVNESGASIYSASEVAREEFPGQDVTVRGSISIGRRLMDPLAELVKIDPKSIGVGQYQHDVDQNKLKHSLTETVESCVNAVGVNVNTASKHLLTYISGLGPQLAENIVVHRRKKGMFKSRKQLKDVPRLGEKAFEQAAGFLRIPDAQYPLDNSAVHPESYHIVEQMAKDQDCEVKEMLRNEKLRNDIDIQRYVSSGIGLPTLQDIKEELAKQGRDPRQKIEAFSFADKIHKINDLQIGMKLPGIVTNITDFGAFVDIGVKQDGLVHISQLKDAYVKHPGDVVSIHQHVEVKVIGVDLIRKRIQLTMKAL